MVRLLQFTSRRKISNSIERIQNLYRPTSNLDFISTPRARYRYRYRYGYGYDRHCATLATSAYGPCHQTCHSQQQQLTIATSNQWNAAAPKKSHRQQRFPPIISAPRLSFSSQAAERVSLSNTTSITTTRMTLAQLEDQTDRLLEYIQPSASSSQDDEHKQIKRQIRQNETFQHDLKNNAITLSHFDSVMEQWSHQGTMHAASRSEQLLNALEHNYNTIYESSTSPTHSTTISSLLIPNVISYNHVCHAYANAISGNNNNKNKNKNKNSIHNNRNAALQAEAILDRMIQNCIRHQSLLQHHHNQKHQHQTSSSPPKVPEPSIVTFNTVMNAWAKSHCLEAGKRAEDIFTKMEQWRYDCCQQHHHQNHNNSIIDLEGRHDDNASKKKYYHGVKPNARSLAIVLDSWANSNHKDTVNRVMAILNHAIDKHRHFIHQETSTEDSKDDDDDNNDDEIALLDGPEEEDEEEENDVDIDIDRSDVSNIQLDLIVFHSVLHALAKSSTSNSNSNSNRSRASNDSAMNGMKVAEMAETVFTILQNLNNSGEFQQQLHPQSSSSSLVFNSKNDTHRAPSLEYNQYNLEEDYVRLTPNTRTWSLLVQCWANASQHNNNSTTAINNVKDAEYAAVRAETILGQMEDLYQKGEDVKPNVITYSACITAWARFSRLENSGRGRGSNKGAERALYLLERMEQMYNGAGNEEGDMDKEGEIVIDEPEWEEEEEEEKKEGELLDKPNVVLYNTCLLALCNSQSPQKMTPLPSRKMKNNKNDDEEMSLDTSPPTSLEQAMVLLTKMEQLNMVDVTSYNIILNGYAKQNAAADQVNQVFDRMEKNQITPDTISFNTALDAIARSSMTDSIPRVMALLKHMIQLSQSSDLVTPSTKTFTAALNACSKSPLDEKAKPAQQILRQCIKLINEQKRSSSSSPHTNNNNNNHHHHQDLKLDVYLFSAFLTACANQGGNEEQKLFALKLALETFQEIHTINPEKYTDFHINPYVYGAMIKACGRLCRNREERSRLLDRIFQHCCDSGHVSRIVWQIFLNSSRGANVAVRRKFLSNCSISGSTDDDRNGSAASSREQQNRYQLPLQWCCNVSMNDRPMVKRESTYKLERNKA